MSPHKYFKTSTALMNCFILCFWLLGSLEAQALAENPSEPAQIIVVTVFTSSECPYCENVKELLDDLKTQIPIKTEIFDINKPNDYDLYLKIEATHKNARFAVPLVIVGDKVLIGQSEIFGKLETTIKALQASRQTNPLFGMADSSKIPKKFKRKIITRLREDQKRKMKHPHPANMKQDHKESRS